MSKYLLPPGFKDEIFEQASLEHKYKNKIKGTLILLSKVLLNQN